MNTNEFDFQKRVNVTKEDVVNFVIEDVEKSDYNKIRLALRVSNEILEFFNPEFMSSADYNSEDYFIDISLYFDVDNIEDNQIVFGFQYCGNDSEFDNYEDNYYQLFGNGVEVIYNKAMDFIKENW